MFVLKSDKTLWVDVDDTLVLWNKGEASYRRHEAHILMIKKFHLRGQKVVVWSAGGWEWAEKIVKELELEPYVSMVCAKPHWWIDDLKAGEILMKETHIYLKDEE